MNSSFITEVVFVLFIFERSFPNNVKEYKPDFHNFVSIKNQTEFHKPYLYYLASPNPIMI